MGLQTRNLSLRSLGFLLQINAVGRQRNIPGFNPVMYDYDEHRRRVERLPRATVTHTRDALGRITTLDREDGIYASYSGGGIRQSFTYNSKGELKTYRPQGIAHSHIKAKGRGRRTENREHHTGNPRFG